MDIKILGFNGAELATLLGGISVATERIVDILKGWIRPLNRPLTHQQEPMIEARHRALNQLTSFAVALLISAGTAVFMELTSIFSKHGVSGVNAMFGVVALAVLASGGSGFWNAILGAIGVFSTTAPPPRPRGSGARETSEEASVDTETEPHRQSK